ncbi:preprotein translocase subunit SecY [Candidatus Saccharibacteria bacterium RIFCSPLOWO2_01_FULL_48_13]|nr:MAG: preprotein translocase subunit SecY [Candidatus Saccharibacteria bacterium RIFCSPHIGHO2_01_FULL_48_12]OGL35323.1 MAG: preprotein translocase subunit SecY [Candidatus Saccharibacteria bacterium RIFCSPHIGHO2_12_FULL_48_21]OGL37558.1 MAG: preprotein translocase subunit SecY [Candidatus Saccharibacteria bacterium RIFCSPLOWO2_01_FULL_48_13]
MNWSIIAKSLGHHEMRKRIFAVLGIILVFRILAHVPVPLSDPETLKQVLENLYTQTNSQQLLGFLNVLSGGALANFSIMLVGLGPYINASIIMQLLTKAIPKLEAMNKEGEYGRRKINQMTRMLTFPLAIIQSIGTIYLIRGAASSIGGLGDITANTSTGQWVLMVAALTGGAMILMWLGELITERGIGNGISLLIAIGIVASLPVMIGSLAGAVSWDNTLGSDRLNILGLELSRKGVITVALVSFATIFVTWAVVKLNEASRRLTVHYAKRVSGNRTYGGVTTTLPVKLITAGVIPIIFAIAFLSVPGFIGQLLTHGQGTAIVADTKAEEIGVRLTELFQAPTPQTFATGGWEAWIYPLTYFFLVFIFTYFYTSVAFNSKEIAENLQKQGGFFTGIRSGKQTEVYLGKVVNRLTLFGATALGLLAIMPIIAQIFVGQTVANIAIGGTSILILVSVSLETLRQIESRALMITYDQYEQPDYFHGDTIEAGKRQKRFRLWRRRKNG